MDLSELQVLVRGPGLCDRWVWNNHLALLQIENNEPYYFAVLRKFKLVPGCSCLNNHPRGCTPCAYGVSAARFNHCDTLANCGHLQEELYKGLDTHSNFERGTHMPCSVRCLPLCDSDRIGSVFQSSSWPRTR